MVGKGLENRTLRQHLLTFLVAAPREQAVSCATQMLGNNHDILQLEKNALGVWPKFVMLSQELVHLPAENLCSGKSNSIQIPLKLHCGGLEFIHRTTLALFLEKKNRKQTNKQKAPTTPGSWTKFYSPYFTIERDMFNPQNHIFVLCLCSLYLFIY